MAKIIETDTEELSIMSSYSLWRNALVGLILGLVFYGISALIEKYYNSPVVAGGIAVIICGAIGIVIMARMYMPQTLIINLAAAATLWGLAEWTNGLGWLEVVIWSVMLYGLAYVVFSWVARFTKATPVVISVIIIIIAARTAAAL